MSEVNNHRRKNALTIVTSNEPLKIRCHATVMQQRATEKNVHSKKDSKKI